MKAKKPKSPFEKSRRIEAEYARSLRAVAREIGRIISGYDATDPAQRSKMDSVLRQYAEILHPWAQAKASLVVGAINQQDAIAWRQASADLSFRLREEIALTPVGLVMRQLIQEQAELITSLPIKAAERVQKLAIKAFAGGERSINYIEEIQRSGDVTKARATMIARTETSKAGATLTQARAEHVGSKGYIWKTAHDDDVRPSHKKMNDVYVAWDKPPTLDGMTGHAGCLPNCRCYSEPVFSDKYD